MDCSTVSVDVDHFSTNLSQSHPRARKEHRCGECREIIAKGEVYLREVNIHDGRVITDKTCQACVGIRNEFFKDGYYYGEVVDMLYEHIHEVSGDISESCLASLPAGSREKVLSILEEFWGNYEDDE